MKKFSRLLESKGRSFKTTRKGHIKVLRHVYRGKWLWHISITRRIEGRLS